MFLGGEMSEAVSGWRLVRQRFQKRFTTEHAEIAEIRPWPYYLSLRSLRSQRLILPFRL
jgi:hypothetical protein